MSWWNIISPSEGLRSLAVLAVFEMSMIPGQEPRIPLREESWRAARHAHLAEVAGDADEVFLLEPLAGKTITR